MQNWSFRSQGQSLSQPPSPSGSCPAIRDRSCSGAILAFSSNSCLHHRERAENSPPRLSFSRAQFQHHPSGKVQVSLRANRHCPRGSFICTQLPRVPCTSLAFSPLNNPPRHGQTLPKGRKYLSPCAAGKAGISKPPRKPPRLAQAPSAEGCSPPADASRNVKDTAQVKSTSSAL